MNRTSYKKQLISGGLPASLYDDTFYATHYTEMSLHDREEVDTREARALRFLQPLQGTSLLDVGCGIGTLTIKAAALGATCVGIDYSEDAIRIANIYKKKLPKSLSEKVSFRVMDAVDLSFSDASFDRVVSIDMIEHVYPEALREAFKEINRVTKREGRIVMRTMPNAFFQGSIEFLARLIVPNIRFASNAYHINVQNYFSLAKYLHYIEGKSVIHMTNDDTSYFSARLATMQVPSWIRHTAETVDILLDSQFMEFVSTSTPLRILLGRDLWIESVRG